VTSDSTNGRSIDGDPTPDAPKADAAKRPAFPVKKLVISAVGIAVAVWVWLGSGWRWDVTPLDLAEERTPLTLSSWVGRYVRLMGSRDTGRRPVELPESANAFFAYTDAEGHTVLVRLAADDPAPEIPISGRVMGLNSGQVDQRKIVDATRGRWDARSVVAVVMVIWGLVHAGANVHIWRRRRARMSALRPD
jgi:hypothetical protein